MKFRTKAGLGMMKFPTHNDRLALAENAIHKALAHIQDQFLTDGGYADAYFESGELREFKEMRQLLAEYIEAEQEWCEFEESNQ
jgi:hypothetical protein